MIFVTIRHKRERMFNPFPWVEQFYDEQMKEMLDIPEEQTLKEKFLER